ncbi:LysM peptidoglycan-binding domain-containing protein [Marinactinospora thermotolerans]|uniref:LysM domain-containing protein n=1 Tax=Marinactinospora thermotolerans DSM 45154 TaxID=1122192 RepID=A0A1T4SNV4_9ACTN|nr:LysM peptidoglycan-binding domain-containing protein [Marinactinospora thermotolerans]SKA29588.1 LysM domain-containing protein [Marinactinospora thermotolerans DSM 45154]
MRTESGDGVAAVPPLALADLPELDACPPGRHGARLTRRGRVVILSALAAVAAGGFSMAVLTTVALGASTAGASTDALLPTATPTVIVEEGDTLWEIAERVRPGDDPRRTVHELVELNGLANSALEPGQELLVPDAP